MKWFYSVFSCLFVGIGNFFIIKGFDLAEKCPAEFEQLADWMNLPVLLLLPEDFDDDDYYD